MDFEKELQKRKALRYKEFDYNSIAVYFITICTKNRQCMLSKIVGTGVLDCPQIKLTNYGKIADKYIQQLNNFYDYLSIESYIIMPNHIHFLLFIQKERQTFENGQSRTPVPTNIERANSLLSQFISTFKRFCNKEYGENIWQARFYDHIIRNHKDFENHLKYIYENPIQWYFDELYSDE
jgi:REP element-mobilizing transposase RayT